jgi:hypothetical protein
MALGILEPKTVEAPPGTEYLVDNDQTAPEHQYEHSHLKHGKGNIILIPQPSEDPNDPLVSHLRDMV